MDTIHKILKIDEFVKNRIHHVFGVSCLVFGKTLRTSYQDVIPLKTKHQTLNTLLNKAEWMSLAQRRRLRRVLFRPTKMA